jgi:methionyl-tRNA formyltransferase
MENSEFKIVFMGTPEFAVCILDKLFNENLSIVGVITAPDKPAGRGQQLQESAVKKYAVSKSLNVLQPTNLKDEDFQFKLKSLNADLFVVVAFRMLPESVWSMASKGTINLHASLLPQYRGAAPINWAIIKGEKQTGVTTFFIEKEIDTGKVIERSSLFIDKNETVGELHDRLMKLGAELTYTTVLKISKGIAEPIDQQILSEGEIKNAPKIFKKDCEINFNQPAEIVHNFIRGLSPYPAAWCTLVNTLNEKKTFKLFISEVTNSPVFSKSIISESKEGLLFPCQDNLLLVTEIQPEGKRRMNFKEFLAGNNIDNWQLETNNFDEE